VQLQQQHAQQQRHQQQQVHSKISNDDSDLNSLCVSDNLSHLDSVQSSRQSASSGNQSQYPKGSRSKPPNAATLSSSSSGVAMSPKSKPISENSKLFVTTASSAAKLKKSLPTAQDSSTFYVSGSSTAEGAEMEV
jgi:hypothetical protein